MTFDDINMVIEAHNKKQKANIRDRYDLCKLNAYFVGLTMNGKEIPELYDIYPGVFEEDIDEEATIKYHQKQFAMLATVVNSSRKGT